MSKLPHDISDDEIRIISNGKKILPDDLAEPAMPQRQSGRRRRTVIISIVAALGLIAAIVVLSVTLSSTPEADDVEEPVIVENVTEVVPDSVLSSPVIAVAPHVEVIDTVINGTPLSVFIPVNATPRLYVGNDVLDDSTAVLVAQAADIRRDNGEIVGAYVCEGQLLSKGQPKSGFCAIINGSPIIGVADSTPYLEQAIETDGYFFRQYPLVVANHVVENKQKRRSLRKALAEWNGRIAVIVSHKQLTFHDFAQALVDMGVTNAIYLVGSKSYGLVRDADGNRIVLGSDVVTDAKNVNYIVWQ